MVRYIFSINTGRSGSTYLCKIFQHVARCRSFHEPAPIGNGRPMRRFLKGHVREMRKLVEAKVERISKITGDDETYVETNHCFIKGFGWLIPQYLSENQLGIVILRRQPEKVVQSMMGLGVTPLVATGRDWIMAPVVADPHIPPPGETFGRKLTYHTMRAVRLPFRGARLYRRLGVTKPRTPEWIQDYEKRCLRWYVDESFARALEYRRRFPGIHYFETDIEELNDLVAVNAMLRYFGCEPLASIANIVGIPLNVSHAAPS